MIADQLGNWRAFAFFTRHPVWREAFEWIEKCAATAEEGCANLSHEGCLVRVMTYLLKPRAAARFESHRNCIDLQYTISGAEAIEWHPVDGLTPREDSLPDKDVQYYETPRRAAGRVDNLEGALLHPLSEGRSHAARSGVWLYGGAETRGEDSRGPRARGNLKRTSDPMHFAGASGHLARLRSRLIETYPDTIVAACAKRLSECQG